MIVCSVHAKLFFGVREGAYSKLLESHFEENGKITLDMNKKKNNKLRGLSLQANYTDRATATCQ
jgi:hypothetical protein